MFLIIFCIFHNRFSPRNHSKVGNYLFNSGTAWLEKLEKAPPIKHYFENQNDVYYVKCIPKTTGNKASLCFCKLLCTCFFLQFSFSFNILWFCSLKYQNGLPVLTEMCNSVAHVATIPSPTSSTDDYDDGKNNQLSVWRAFQMSMSTCEMLPQGATMWKLGPGYSIIDS